MTPTAIAMTANDLESIAEGTPFYDPNALCKVEREDEVETSTSLDAPLDDRGKLAQMLFVRADNASELTTLLSKRLGGIFLGNDALVSDDAALAKIKTATPIPLVGVDEEGGTVQRLDAKYGYMQSARDMASKTDAQVTQIADARAKIMKNIGINVDFAPVVDVTASTSGVIGTRSFSGNSLIVTAKANAFAAGLRANKVLPVFKHFPGHGSASGDSHTGAVTTPNLASLKTSDLVPYTNVMKQGPSGVMMGHLNVPGLTDADGVPSSLSKSAIGLLRGEYGFNGLLITDELGNMKAISDRFSLPEAVSRALIAGNDMALFVGANRVDEVLNKLEQDLASGALPRARLDEAFGRITEARTFAGLGNVSGEVQIGGGIDGAGGGGGTLGTTSPLGGADRLLALFNVAGAITGVPPGVLGAQSYQESGSYWNTTTFTNDYIKQHSYLNDGGKQLLPPEHQNVNYIGASGPMQLDQYDHIGDFGGNYNQSRIDRFKIITGVDFPVHGEFYFDTAIIMAAIIDADIANSNKLSWSNDEDIITIMMKYGTVPKAEPLHTKVKTKFLKNYHDLSGSINSLQIGNAYMMGDSITFLAKDKYQAAFQAKGATLTMSAVGARSWTYRGTTDPSKYVGTPGTGKDALETDAQKVKDADVVIMALGTNGGLAQNPPSEIIQAIRKHNSSAPIIWVSIAGTHSLVKSLVVPFNAELDNQVAAGKIKKVADWAEAVDPGGDGTHDTKGLLKEDGIHAYGNNIDPLVATVMAALDDIGGVVKRPDDSAKKCDGDSPDGPQTLIQVSPDVGEIDPATLPKLKFIYTPETKEVKAENKQNVLIGKSLAAAYGWDKGNEWMCLYDLYVRESNWNHLAKNPTSGAYGIPQSYPASKLAAEGPDWRTNPATQIKWGLKYFAGRKYKTPCAAIVYHNANNSY